MISNISLKYWLKFSMNAEKNPYFLSLKGIFEIVFLFSNLLSPMVNNQRHAEKNIAGPITIIIGLIIFVSGLAIGKKDN